jgi:hypothetical protein
MTNSHSLLRSLLPRHYQMYVYRSPADDPENCLLDADCFEEITTIVNKQMVAKEYQNLLSEELGFHPSDNGGVRHLEQQMVQERGLLTCTHCKMIYGYWVCAAIGYCRRRLGEGAAANIDDSLEEKLEDACWQEKRIEYKNAFQQRLMEQAMDIKKYSVEGIVMVYTCYGEEDNDVEDKQENKKEKYNNKEYKNKEKDGFVRLLRGGE